MTDDLPEDPKPNDTPTEKVTRGTGPLARQEENEPGNYLDFEIEIGQGAGRQYPLAVIDSPAGEAREMFSFPFDELALENRLQNLEIALLRSGGARRQVLSPEEQSVQDFGRQLFASLFSGEARTRYDMSSDIARQRGLGLRLKLRIQAPELARLPWEFLYDPRQGEYVCMSRDTPIVRYIELPQPIKPLNVEPPLHILGMVSSPANLPTLDVARERKRLEKAIASLKTKELIKLTWLSAPTWRELQRAMRNGPWHIFHFIGHGGFDPNADEGVIAFEDEDGRAQLLLATELGRLLSDHRSLRLALLNACEGARGSQHDIFSSSAAVLVRRGLPAVLAMQYAITDRAAIEFSRAFYEALADGLPVDAAVCEARKAVSLAITNTLEWGTPVLYMRSPQGIIFELPEPTQPQISIPHPLTSEDKEMEARIDRLYTEGRAAFWIEDWDRACARFQSILDIRPNHPEAAAALEEANQNRQRAALYARAREAQQAEKWDETVSALEELTAQAHEYKDSATLLQTARKKKQLADLYEEARKLHDAKQWQAVVRVFAQLHNLQTDFPDPDGLLPSAEKEVAELKRQAELEAAYSQSIRAMDAGRWPEALTLLEKVQAGEPGYREVESLLKRARGEVEKAQKNRQAQEQVNSLYEQAHGLVRAKQWRKALDKLDETRKVDESFSDPDGLAEKARSALEREEQEAQRQSELSLMYAEAVQLLKDEKYQQALEKWGEIHAWDPKFPDRQKVQATAKKKLAELGKPKTAKPAPWTRINWRRVGQITALVIVLAAMGVVISQSQPPASERTPSGSTQSGAGALAVNPTNTKKASASATPRPTTIPTAVSAQSQPTETDPTLYDDFNSPNFRADTLWRVGEDKVKNQITQKDGMLSLKNNGGVSEFWANRSILAPKTPMFYEAMLFLDPNPQSSETSLYMGIQNEQNSYSCMIEGNTNSTQTIWCESFFSGNITATYMRTVDPGWHLMRIELNPEPLTFSYFIDNCKFGEFSPSQSASEEFLMFIGMNNFGKAEEALGHIDYVHFGTVASDPTNYDNFDDDAFDGGYNHIKWREWDNPQNGSIYQEDNVLIMTQKGEQVNRTLYTTKTVTIDNSPIAMDFDLKIDPSVNDFVAIDLSTDFLRISCGIHGMKDEWAAHCWYPNYDSARGISIKMGQWHHYRILIDPIKKTFTFYIDGDLHDVYTYTESQSLVNSQFWLNLSVMSHTRNLTVKGYFDNIKVEQSISDQTTTNLSQVDPPQIASSPTSKTSELAGMNTPVFPSFTETLPTSMPPPPTSTPKFTNTPWIQPTDTPFWMPTPTKTPK